MKRWIAVSTAAWVLAGACGKTQDPAPAAPAPAPPSPPAVAPDVAPAVGAPEKAPEPLAKPASPAPDARPSTGHADCDKVLQALCDASAEACAMMVERTKAHPPTPEDQVECTALMKDPKKLEDLKNSIKAAIERKQKISADMPVEPPRP